MISWSLRSRVLTGLAAIALVLVGVAAAVTSTIENRMIGQIDEQLENIARDGGGIPGSLRSPARRDERRERFSVVYEAVVLMDGTVVSVYVPNTPGKAASPPDIAAADLEGRTWSPFTVAVSDSELRYRVLASESAFSDVAYNINALPLDDVDETVRRLVAFQTVGVVIVLAALGAVAWWVIHLGIRPVQAMTDAADQIAAGDLSQRVPEPAASGTESGRLARALNAMLGRIEGEVDARTRSEERLRTFVADASHELRTPVTTIRGYTDLYAHGGLTDRGDLDDAMRRTREEAARMSRLVEDMLTLAKLDRERPDQKRIVDVTAILDDAAADLRVTAPDRPVTTNVTEGLVVSGDDDRLRQVVTNLVGNAVVHTPPGTPVSLTGTAHDDQVIVLITDEGPGMASEVANRVTERFFRADPSRSRAAGGSGLGLAIADAVVAAHGGTLAVRSEPGRGTTVEVRLPSAT